MATPLGAMHTPDCSAFRGVSPWHGPATAAAGVVLLLLLRRTCVGTPSVVRAQRTTAAATTTRHSSQSFYVNTCNSMRHGQEGDTPVRRGWL